MCTLCCFYCYCCCCRLTPNRLDFCCCRCIHCLLVASRIHTLFFILFHSATTSQSGHFSMQRGPYSNIGPAQSPPLHHPVPQHVSTVPQLRSPPPPFPQQQSQQGYAYAAQQQQQPPIGGAYAHPAFGGFINDPTAQMGFQVGKTALNAGTEYMEQNVCLRSMPQTWSKHID